MVETFNERALENEMYSYCDYSGCFGLNFDLIKNKDSIHYIITPETPNKIYRDALHYLIQLTLSYAKNNRDKERLYLAREMIEENDYDPLFIKEFINMLYGNLKKEGYKILKELERTNYDSPKTIKKLNNLILKQTILQLQSYGKFLTEKERTIIRKISLLKNFDPEILKIRNLYNTRVLTDENEILDALDRTKTCKRGDISTAEKWAEDEGTFFVGIYNTDDEPVGYVRLFLYRNDSEQFLALDTVEVPRTNKTSFEDEYIASFDLSRKMARRYIDIIKAGGLASIALLLDLNPYFLVGKESRVKFGLRQAFGNKKIRTTGKKIGKKFEFSEFYSYPPIINKVSNKRNSSYLLFLNYRRYIEELLGYRI